MLYLVGLGLNDEKDLSFRALGVLKKCDEIYLESYTSYNRLDLSNLESLVNKKIISVDRKFIENRSDEIIKKAKNVDIAILVIGHPLIATTHAMFLTKDVLKQINVKVIHNFSILDAISVTGLEVYKFGRIVSIPFHHATSYLDYIKKNLSVQLHTLCLLDLDRKNNRFMTINEALVRLKVILDKEKKLVACCALATEDEEIFFASLEKLNAIDFSKKPKPQCLIIPTSLHPIEQEVLENYEL